MRPLRLTRCPQGADGSECHIELHGYRPRKTGPCFALAVVRCTRHAGPRFTVYPPRHVPYGRVALLAGEQGTEVPSASSQSATIWQAAYDAAAGSRWPLEGTEPGDRRTQGRRLERCATLLGLDVTLSARTEERVASALSMPLLTMREARSAYAAARSWTARGEAALRALGAVERPAGLLVAGHVAGLWGRPSRWDPGGQVPRPV